MLGRLFIVAALVGCTDSSTDAPGLPATLSIAASTGTIVTGFFATITGSGSDASLGAVSVDANVGTIMLDGDAATAAIYNTVPFGVYQIFGSVVVAPDAWWIVYPYCMDDELVDVYDEAVGPGGFVLVGASGSCTFSSTTAPTNVELPAFAIATPAPFGDATVHGAQIALDHGAGQIAIDGAMLPAVVFNTVDCSTECGTPGWYELHTIVWDATTESATFVIVYLTIGTPDRVQLSYGLRLPTLDDPFGNGMLDATWTAPSARTLAAAPPVHLPPPWLRQPR